MSSQKLKILYGFAVVLNMTPGVMVRAEILVDPTQPAGARAPQAGNPRQTVPQWILQSTLIAGERRLATINGKTVGIGAQINGATVLLIEPGYVRLRIGKQERQLELLPKEFKNMARGETHERQP